MAVANYGPGQSLYPLVPAAQKPAAVTSPVISGTLLPGNTLTVTNGTWLNTPLAYTYQWFVNGQRINGQTTNSYTLTAYDAGKTIEARVYAANAIGSTYDDAVVLIGFADGGASVLPAYMGMVATRGYIPNATTSGSSATTYHTLHVMRQAMAAGSVLRVIYPLWWADTQNGTESSAGAIVATSDASISLNVEYPSGNVIGTASASGTGGGEVVIDATISSAIPDGATFRLSPTVTPSGGAIPYCTASEGTQWGAESANQFYPSIIAATTTKPTFGLFGNSRQVGYSSGSGATVNANGDGGEFAQSIGAKYAYGNFGVNTNRIYWIVRGRKYVDLMAYFSHVVSNDTINDSRFVRGQFTAAQITADLQQFAELAPNKTVILGTATPAQEDAVTADQADSVRVAANTAALALTTPVSAVINIADRYDANHDGFWDGGAVSTTDYVHFNNAGLADLSASSLISADALAAVTAPPRLWSPTLNLIASDNKGIILDASNPSCTGRVPAGGTSFDIIALNRVLGFNQATGAKKPTLTAATIGTKPAFVFTAASSQDVPGGATSRTITNAATGITLHALVKPGTFTGSTMVIIAHSPNASATTSRITISIASTGVLRLATRRIGADTTYLLDGTTVLVAGTVYLITVHADPVTGLHTIRLNGAAEASGTATWTTGATFEALDCLAVTLGSTSTISYFNGAIGLVDTFVGPRVTADFEKLEGRTAYDWGQQALLPGGFPYKTTPPMAP